ncbi:riboflavin synthase [Paenibacillus massiliensis]|uniref:riboflavin synthase n=1 Tax=Paenibacillus massiliensis TaxID=225917 RepID=UPI000471AED3|nr:riboflavin synthase [Paenibacillus massiliensis]
MFTGLVEEVGTVTRITRNGEAMVLHIQAAVIMDDLKLGDSVAVNGVCLTVTQIAGSSFGADVMPQTFRHTGLRLLESGSRVNLERAMLANGRFGGHIVQGHVDATGKIIRVYKDQNAVVFELMPEDTALFKYLIPKGSVTIDGISLTVAYTQQDLFAVSIIPHTLEATALQGKHNGDVVNLECDILGKYVEHLLHARYESGPKKESSRIDMEYLSKHGFC